MNHKKKAKETKVKEIKYYGIHSCLKLFEERKDDIIRLYLDESNLKTFKMVMKWCSQNKKAYHVVTAKELEKITESHHHEGVCLLAKEKPKKTFEDLILDVAKKDRVCLLYLDGVSNPHNIGSIMRAMAHFGVLYILADEAKVPPLSPSAFRIAKGGSEYVNLVLIKNPQEGLKKLKKLGFELVTTSSHGGSSLYKYAFAKKSVIVMGAESEGVSKKLFDLAEIKIQIPGTGLVESLNVSVAASLCVSEWVSKNQLFS
jgi:TrmH RNA methyltransferase